ncbi:ATR-interacting protein isoform X2 [Cheilinus undulatus]|uniref:ATR-interacting protein isoform X2 n=1 Tax=Cheilinus undulatus TaxID=241271 RepID=UPI001BD2B880|nr:ATR-interacting protein isoform X2 [Cheilinus undulatus]
MNGPPTKRLRGLNQDVVMAMPFDDPFGDDDDFTQDDLDEIDIIASQAVTSTAIPGHGPKPAGRQMEPARGPSWSGSAGPSKPVNRATSDHSRETFGFNSHSNSRGNAGTQNREPLSSRLQQQFGSDREDSYRTLEAQHAELKRKLKEVEEEIVLKNGEIRVLRDSLKGAQQEKEAQRQNQMLLETQKQREHSEREKELNRKVQSLQTELQFKEAEINEIKTKLSTDKNKTASPLPRNSPKVLAQLHHGSSSNSSSPANGFITKEMFGASVPARTTPVKTRREDRASSSRERMEVTRPDPFLSVRPAHLQHKGGVLLGLLLQQPLSPSSLGLSHLLSMSLSDIKMTSRRSGGFTLDSDTAASASAGGSPRAAQSPVQSLAVTGLNMLSQSRAETAASSRNKRSCPGAVLLLPLVDLHLSRLCQAFDSLRSSSTASSSSNSTAASSFPAGRAAPAAGPGRLEETGCTGFSVEDTGLAALRLLYLLLAHSDEAVEAVLSKKNQSRAVDKKAEHSTTDVGSCSQNALLQSVLHLCEAGTGGSESSSQRKQLVLSTLKTLCVLIQRAKDTQANGLQCVLPVVCACVSADSRLQTVSECVSVLTSMSDHRSLSQQLCSLHDPCVFLKLFQFIRTRPDNQATQTDWIQLDLQVVRLLSRLMTQRAESWSSSQHSSCPCYTELVQTVVIVFHRQWLDLRGAQELTDSTGLTPPWWRSPAVSLLRECLLLLHWLLLHHGSFSESCRPLLHMYDQVIPAVRDTLKKIPKLSESEELALEEICRSDGDETDDMDTDTGS